MKRKVERSKKLPAFKIGVGELEMLSKRLEKLFDDDKTIYWSCDVKLDTEEISFESIEEIREYPFTQNKITNIYLRLSQFHNEQDNRSVTVRSSYFKGEKGEVSASSENEAWCAGAVETAHSTLATYKVWYNWLSSNIISWFLIICGILCFATMAAALEASETNPKITSAFIYSLMASAITFGILYIGRKKMLPTSVLIIREQENRMKKYAAELSLIIAIGAALLTIIGWFVKT